MPIMLVRVRLPDGREVPVVRMTGVVSGFEVRDFHAGEDARDLMDAAAGYVIDARALDRPATRADSDDIASDPRKLAEPPGARRAIVVADAAGYGVARQISSLATLRGSRAEYQVFRDYDDALRWAAGD